MMLLVVAVVASACGDGKHLPDGGCVKPDYLFEKPPGGELGADSAFCSLHVDLRSNTMRVCSAGEWVEVQCDGCAEIGQTTSCLAYADGGPLVSCDAPGGSGGERDASASAISVDGGTGVGFACSWCASSRFHETNQIQCSSR
jgi:hypothetical protein